MPPHAPRPLPSPRAQQRASGREGRARGLTRTACCEAQSGSIKESNIDCDVPARQATSSRVAAQRRAGREREGGGDNINSADDKMMRGVFSLAEERMTRIAGTRGGIAEGR